MHSWPSVALGEAAQVNTGFPFRSAHYTNDPADPRLIGGDNIAQGVLRWQNVRRWPRTMTRGLEDYWVSQGDVVLAMDRPWIDAGLKRARVGALDMPALLVQRTARLRGTRHLDTRFLYYVISGRAFTEYLRRVQTGTAIPHISLDQIRSFVFKAPPLTEQRAIAAILGALDDKIELNRKMNETLEQMAQAIFKSWFIDFDGHTEFQDSELGRIPKGWRVAPLQDLCLRIENGGTPKRSIPAFWFPSEVPWLTSGEVRRSLVCSTQCHISKAGLANSSAKLWPPGATVVALYGATAGEVCLTSIELAANQACCALITVPENRLFTYFSLLQCQRHLALSARGSAQQNLSQNIVSSLRVVVAEGQSREAFEAACAPLVERSFSNLAQNETLADLRDTLLPKLISGELRIKDAEKLVGEAT